MDSDVVVVAGVPTLANWARFAPVCDVRHPSVIAGTIFERTRMPLSVWFRAIGWVVTRKNGASALGLQRFFWLGSYETVWIWLQKIRRAMVRPDRDRISGRVVSLLKRWILGMHQGAVNPEHLDGYLAEFTFRVTRRISQSRSYYYRLLQKRHGC